MSRALVQRTFVKEGYYHIFNRGNNKKDIFLDQQDYMYFLHQFDCYLLEKSLYRPEWIQRHFCGEVDLIAYCLMPNHFHVLVQQHTERGVAEFMGALMNRYTKYFNKKYQRVGHVFQGKYKARFIDSDGDLIHLTRYVHQNSAGITPHIQSYAYSSAQFYVGGQYPPQWLYSQRFLEFFVGVFGCPKERAHQLYKKYLLS